MVGCFVVLDEGFAFLYISASLNCLLISLLIFSSLDQHDKLYLVYYLDFFWRFWLIYLIYNSITSKYLILNFGHEYSCKRFISCYKIHNYTKPFKSYISHNSIIGNFGIINI
ncbi:hypothetical protein C1645_789539 [Glomus cerebriforme]|uniref:Uncharacterized protein n=1 Tax=Glomus cerebriforme TaxID=658196 RepID=A0A397S601_9GLOM|nr:hypothetical protein C1645_789539 [Glomus cerebriforme]